MSELGNGEVVRERVRRKGRKRLKVSKQREKKDKKIRECIKSGRKENLVGGRGIETIGRHQQEGKV